MTIFFRVGVAHLGRCVHRRKPFAGPALALCFCLVGGLLTGCAESRLAPTEVVPTGDVELAVIELDWHTELGIPVDQISGPLASAVPFASGDKYLVVGFGDLAYFTDHDAGAGTALAALFAGPSAIQLAAFETLPEDDTHIIVKLHLSREGLDQISRFIWESLERRGDGRPRQVAENNPRSLFFAGRQAYDAFYNCNNWTAEALKAGGLPFDPAGIVFASEVMAEARRVASLQAASSASRPAEQAYRR